MHDERNRVQGPRSCSWSSGETLSVVERRNAPRGCRGGKALTLGVSGEQGSPECQSRAAWPWRVSNRRTVGLGQGGSTPLVVGAGARKPMPECRDWSLPHTSPLRCISAHFVILSDLLRPMS